MVATLSWAVALVLSLLAGPMPLSGHRRVVAWSVLQLALAALVALASGFTLSIAATSRCELALAVVWAPTACRSWQGFTAGLIGYLLVAGWGQVILMWRDRRRLDRLFFAAEVRRLRTQLNPHFLYNALNAVAELAYDEPQSADRAITQLSSLLRKSLDEGHLTEIALREEIEFLKRYLDIQRVLLRERLVSTFEVDGRTLAARVPSMIVQPLVENAVTHGLGRDGTACIHVRSRVEGEQLIVEVEDCGPGLETPVKSSGGVGLANIRARLAHLYGAAASLGLHARPSGGLIARLSLPFHEAFAYDETPNATR